MYLRQLNTQIKTSVAPPLRLLVAALLLLAATGSQAAQSLTLRLQTLQGPAGIMATEVELEVDLSGTRPAGVLRIGRLVLPAADQRFSNVVLRCPKMMLSNHRIVCTGGTLRLSAPYLAQTELPVSFDYRVLEKRLRLQLPRLVSTYNSASGEIANDGLDLALELPCNSKPNTGALKANCR